MTVKKTTKKNIKLAIKAAGTHFFKYLWGESWTYIKTVVNVVEEPVLILDENLYVMAANEPFYQTFRVKPKDTEGKTVFELGNGQWNIPELRKLLINVLPKNSFFKGFGVTHKFPFIGQRTMILNARQLYFNGDINPEPFSPIILLAMEDVTTMMAAAEKLTNYTDELETKLLERTDKLEICIERLKKEISEIKKNLNKA